MVIDLNKYKTENDTATFLFNDAMDKLIEDEAQQDYINGLAGKIADLYGANPDGNMTFLIKGFLLGMDYTLKAVNEGVML